MSFHNLKCPDEQRWQQCARPLRQKNETLIEGRQQDRKTENVHYELFRSGKHHWFEVRLCGRTKYSFEHKESSGKINCDPNIGMWRDQEPQNWYRHKNDILIRLQLPEFSEKRWALGFLLCVDTKHIAEHRESNSSSYWSSNGLSVWVPVQMMMMPRLNYRKLFCWKSASI